MKIMQIYDKFRECGSVTTDSRTLKGGEMFFALKGENFDGNEYALKALEAGAAYAVVNASSEVGTAVAEGRLPSDVSERLVIVEDTLKTLQELARWHRSMTFVDGKPLTVIALTGTNGKTTTKELIREVLSVKYKVTATEGNLNNSIGVPLTLLKIDSQTQIAVVEMGASHPGDIKELVDIALPNYGLITNVGKAHLLGFGSFEGVMATKGELYDYLRRTSDMVFLNVDNPYLCRMAAERNLQSDPERPYSLVLPYGVEYQGCSVLPSDADSPYLRISHPDYGVISTNLVGSYNADNVMAAIAVGSRFGVSLEDAAKAIEAYVPSNNRSQMTKTGRNVLIVDAYNANPSSMDVALKNLSSVVAERKAVMLGDMLELGADSQSLHREVVEKLLVMDLSLICLVGKEFAEASAGIDGILCFETSDALAQWLKENPLDGATALIKGSRGTKMEKVIPML
ncbi:MAG: UDP-N-acetylmuramoyl-tripeptide--D-alanyl-D-alanine ligase [Bacteroidales bacterium]|nr:UDP-N-acetylmuramoyl-tripeptide--D-alanyl-D-alanine ligase [Bacteroidales bacterium]MBQ9722746.1 UDP-N-acetylmuramoyl-tripeptide--D-alanyl-D-alanine ligase [Bacteroidales bacterium]